MENKQPQNDELLWQLAKKRAEFKKHITTYVLVNSFLIATWFFTGQSRYFWPIWPILGWGFGVFMNYLDAYKVTNIFSVEKEFEKLKNSNK